MGSQQIKVTKREIWMEAIWDVKVVDGQKVLVFIFPNESKVIEIPFGEGAAQSLASKLGQVVVETAPASILDGLPGGPSANGRKG